MQTDIKTADGVDIEPGETYYTKDCGPFKVYKIVISKEIHIFDSALTHVNPHDLYAEKPEPDSWEKLEEDVKRGMVSACHYFGRDAYRCEGCLADTKPETCNEVMIRNILARAKKLAVVE